MHWYTLFHYQCNLQDTTDVEMQCLGEATTSQPPDGILAPKSPVGSLSTPVFRAVSIPPSHRRNIKPPMLSATSTIRNTLQCSSRASSGVSGPGYYSTKMIEWLGETSINLVESAIIFKRCWQYRYELKRWEGYEGGAADEKREKLFFDMLGDLVELSRSVLDWYLTLSDFFYLQGMLLRSSQETCPFTCRESEPTHWNLFRVLTSKMF